MYIGDNRFSFKDIVPTLAPHQGITQLDAVFLQRAENKVSNCEILFEPFFLQLDDKALVLDHANHVYENNLAEQSGGR